MNTPLKFGGQTLTPCKFTHLHLLLAFVATIPACRRMHRRPAPIGAAHPSPSSGLDRIRFPEWPVVVIIRPAWKFRLSHCIVVKGEFVHDPNGTHAVRLDQYDRGDWRVCLILQPASPGAVR